jgi:hypothetical protein
LSTRDTVGQNFDSRTCGALRQNRRMSRQQVERRNDIVEAYIPIHAAVLSSAQAIALSTNFEMIKATQKAKH